MLSEGVTYGELEGELRALFVEVAECDFATAKPKQTDSRIAVLTGINRKEVRRLRGKAAQVVVRQSFARNWAADLVNRWINEPEGTGPSGRPVPLPYTSGSGLSFVKLAEQTTADVQPRALLDVLLSAGAAELRKGKVVALTRASYVPRRGHSEGLAMLADDPPELIETMLHNVLTEDPPRLQRKLAFDNIGSEGLERLQMALRKEAERFLKKSERVLNRHDRDRNPKGPAGERSYAGIGVYYFESATPEPETDPTAVRKRPRKTTGDPA